jgi:hypothetical protein
LRASLNVTLTIKRTARLAWNLNECGIGDGGFAHEWAETLNDSVTISPSHNFAAMVE